MIFVSAPTAKADLFGIFGTVKDTIKNYTTNVYNYVSDLSTSTIEKTELFKNTLTSFNTFSELLHQGLTNNTIYDVSTKFHKLY